jgi:SAM-dependent methyltransferase
VVPENGQGQEFGNLEANLCFLARTGRLTRDAHALEVGTGSGSMLAYLRREGYDVRGVDVNATLVKAATERYGDLPITLTASTALPFGNAEFDVVLSFDVFEHIPDSDAHLREVARVLRPGGTYLMMTPNKWTNSVFETFRWRSFTRWRQDHCSLHTPTQLEHRLARHGFAVTFYDIPVVNAFFRRKVREYAGPVGTGLLTVFNPDRLPRALRTNIFVEAVRLP